MTGMGDRMSGSLHRLTYCYSRSAQEALEFGIVDTVLERRPKMDNI